MGVGWKRWLLALIGFALGLSVATQIDLSGDQHTHQPDAPLPGIQNGPSVHNVSTNARTSSSARTESANFDLARHEDLFSLPINDLIQRNIATLRWIADATPDQLVDYIQRNLETRHPDVTLIYSALARLTELDVNAAFELLEQPRAEDLGIAMVVFARLARDDLDDAIRKLDQIPKSSRNSAATGIVQAAPVNDLDAWIGLEETLALREPEGSAMAVWASRSIAEDLQVDPQGLFARLVDAYDGSQRHNNRMGTLITL